MGSVQVVSYYFERLRLKDREGSVEFLSVSVRVWRR